MPALKPFRPPTPPPFNLGTMGDNEDDMQASTPPPVNFSLPDNAPRIPGSAKPDTPPPYPMDTSQYEAEIPNIPPPFKPTPEQSARDQYAEALKQGPKRSILGTLAAAAIGGAAGYLNASGKRIHPVQVDPEAMANLASGGYGSRLKRLQAAAGLEAQRESAGINQRKIEAEIGKENAQARQANATAKALEEEGKQSPKADYITPSGGGLFNARTGEWVKQPTDKTDMQQIDPEKAKSLGIQPLADGTFAIPKSAVGQYLSGQFKEQQPDKNSLTPDQINRYNTNLERRFQVLNPGQKLPDSYRLPPTATVKDYEMVDKSLERVESASATKAQRDQIAAMRAEAASARADAQQDRKEKEGRRVVTGIEPSTGRTVVGSVEEARKGGWEGVMDLPAADQSQVNNARHWVNNIVKPTATADPVKNPEDAGVMQLVDALEQRGALGPVASRWNEFMAKNGISTGDPETDRMISALRTKIGLSSTLLMKVHVGNRGAAAMLEHFDDLANQKKLDANRLRAGLRSEINYVNGIAAVPSQSASPQQPKAGGGSPQPKPGKKLDLSQFER